MFRFLTVAAVMLTAIAAVPLLDRVSRPVEPSPGLRPSQGSHPSVRSPVPGPSPALSRANPAEVIIPAGRDGHFTVTADIRGRRLDMLVDTGASVVALTYEDAQRMGLHPGPSDFRLPVSTANGVVRAAPMRLGAVRIETIRLPDVDALVMPQGAMSQSLLGMSFLRRLRRFEIEGTRLVLAP